MIKQFSSKTNIPKLGDSRFEVIKEINNLVFNFYGTERIKLFEVQRMHPTSKVASK